MLLKSIELLFQSDRVLATIQGTKMEAQHSGYLDHH